jgi:hypothetical protein
MTVVFHPEFPKDVQKYQSGYLSISERLAARFRQEIDEAIAAIQNSPGSAGHLLNLKASLIGELRRKNLRAFPFFVLYGVTPEHLIIGSIIPSRSDPLTWLARFSGKKQV